MAVIHFNEQGFDKALSAGGLMMVDFWASWCGPCKMQAPVIDQLGDKYEGKFKVAKVNVDDEPSIAARFGVMSIPTLIVFNNGDEMVRRVGVQSLPQLEQMLGMA